MAKLKFKNPKTGLWEEAGGTTYTAGSGITISDSNVISGDFSGLFESKEIIASTPIAPYNDCNTLPTNTCVSYAIYVNSSALANKPSSFNNGTITTLGPKEGTSIVTQIAVNGSNIMWHRAKYGSTWTEWIQEMTDSSVHSRSYTTISMFDKVGVVGDSFASGATYGVSGVEDGEHYGIAWGRILSKRNNISVNIFAASGLSTKTWLEDNNGLAALQAKDPQDLYLLCLGINDNKTGADPIGTVDDIHDNDYTQNPSTFFGNYGRIVAQIKIHAPTSKLIFIVPKGYKANNIGIAISQIAEHYSVPCIRFDDDPFFSSTFYQNNLHTGHPVGITYAGMATAIERLYSKCAIDNPTYFIDYISKYSYTYNNEGNVSATGNNNLTGNNTFTGTITVPTPTADTEAATKKYVDDHAGGGGDVTAAGNNVFTGTNEFQEPTTFISEITIGSLDNFHFTPDSALIGGQATFTGPVYVEWTPDSDTSAVNKKYVDDHAIKNVTATATSIDSSKPATATATISSNDISFAFGIPKGPKGDTGAQGPTGPAGQDGTQITSVSADATTLSYYESATANVNFTNGNMHFTFGIPQGEPAENPCLIEGTQITMADNTTKSVEDLKPGDVILSYDPVKKQKTNAVIIDAYKTGEAKVFDVYSFENGKYLTVYGIHGFYANELGYVKNIQDITKTNELIDENLNTTYLIVKRKMPLRDKPKSRYMIISSNNLYFANGILLGHSPWNKGQYCIKYGIEVPEAIREIYQSEINAYNGYDSFINTPEYHAEISEQYAKLANAVNEIKIYKDKLTATDYKVQKYTEGVLPEAEWQEAKAKRAAWRQAVNDNEQLRDESRKMVNSIIKKYRNGVTMKQLFEESCIKDNESFETIKNYFDN